MMRVVGDFQLRLRFAQMLALGMMLAGCNAPNMSDMSQLRLVPEARTFLPSNANTYSSAQAMRVLPPITAGDLVDAQGVCPGMTPPPPPPDPGADPAQTAAVAPMASPSARGVGLEMTECEVARALGVPQRAEIGNNERGERRATLTYFSPERSGIYRFTDGRLITIERGPEPPAPPAAKKATKAAKKKTAPAKKTPADKLPDA